MYREELHVGECGLGDGGHRRLVAEGGKVGKQIGDVLGARRLVGHAEGLVTSAARLLILGAQHAAIRLAGGSHEKLAVYLVERVDGHAPFADGACGKKGVDVSQRLLLVLLAVFPDLVRFGSRGAEYIAYARLLAGHFDVGDRLNMKAGIVERLGGKLAFVVELMAEQPDLSLDLGDGLSRFAVDGKRDTGERRQIARRHGGVLPS